MPSHYGSGMGAKKKKPKSMLTAKQKTLPEALKKKIIKSKMKKAQLWKNQNNHQLGT